MKYGIRDGNNLEQWITRVRPLFLLFMIFISIVNVDPVFANANNCKLANGINIQTGKQILTICDQHQLINEFKISIGRKGVGKHSDGDKKTPIGLYKLGTPRQSNRFGIFIPILYPTPQQAASGYTGKDVGIHGPFQLFIWLGSLNTLLNWTQDYIAVGDNKQIAFIARWIKGHPSTMILIE